MEAATQPQGEPVDGEVRAKKDRTPFVTFLTEHRKGTLHEDLSEALAEVVRAVEETGKAGSVTLKIGVAKPKEGMAEVVIITDVLTTKAPVEPTKPSLFFYDEDGNVSRRDPRQAELPLREVPGGEAS